MAAKPKIIYWDSCVFISAIQETRDRYDILKNIIKAANAKESIIVTSALTIVEVTKVFPNTNPTQAGKKESELEQDDLKIRQFFDNPYFSIRQLDRATAEEAASISRKHGIKPADAIHIATALRSSCLRLQTYDGENPEKNRKKLIQFNEIIGTPPLKIEIPRWPLSGESQSLF